MKIFAQWLHKSNPSSWNAEFAVRRYLPWIRLAVSLALLYLVLQQVSLSMVFYLIKESVDRWPYLIAAIILSGLGVLFAVYRWRILLGGVAHKPALALLAKAWLVGNFFNQFLPSTIGGDVVRGWWIRGELGSGTLSLAIVVLDRLFGLLGLGLVGLIVALIRPDVARDLPEVWVTIGLIAMISVAFLALLQPWVSKLGQRILPRELLERNRHKITVLHRGLASLSKSRVDTLIAVLLSMGLQTSIVCQYLVLAKALNINVASGDLAVIMPMIIAIALIPFSIMGIGLREVSLATFGSVIGMSISDAVALSWLYISVAWLWSLVGGMIYFVNRSHFFGGVGSQ